MVHIETINRKYRNLGSDKRAQTEAFGLLIVIVIIALLALLVVRFIILKPESTTNLDIKKTIIANNALNALLKTTIGELSAFDLLKESPNDAEEMFRNMLNSLNFDQRNYKLIAKKDNLSLFLIGDCENGIAATPYIISSQSSLYELEFYLC